MLSKALILDQIKKRGLGIVQGEQEVEYFGKVFSIVREKDFERLHELSRSHPEELKGVLKTLEERGARRFESDEPARSYKYCLIRRLFSGSGENDNLPDVAGAAALDDKHLLELYHLFSSRPFGVKESNKLRARIQEWELGKLRDWTWNEGLCKMLNARYRDIKNLKGPKIPIKEILEKERLPRLINENQFIDNYVFDNLRQSKSVTGMRTDVFLEKKMRQEAMELRDHLYDALKSQPINFSYLKKTMLDLHMEREVENIERAGCIAFNDWLEENWHAGARELASQYSLDFVPPADKDSLVSSSRINKALLAQIHLKPAAAKMLQWEAILDFSGFPDEASCYLMREDYIVVRVLQEQAIEHVLVVQLHSVREREKFISACLGAFFSDEDPRIAAARLVEKYLRDLAGWLRLRKAMQFAVIALPVVLVSASVLAGIYKVTMGDTSEALMLGLLLSLFGEILAARNGYVQKVRPESHEKIPEYMYFSHVIPRISADEGSSESPS